MKAMRLFLFAAIALTASSFSEKGTWIIDADSELMIHGSTNVNNFTCKIDCLTGLDTLHYMKNYAACELQFSRNRMTIPVRRFNCGAKQISNDFRKTLKSDQYPVLDITFQSLQNLSVKHNSTICGVVDITLAGVTRTFTIKYKAELKDRNTILLKGVHPVNFSDFNLTAPAKLNGLIKVKEALNVEFNLVLKEV